MFYGLKNNTENIEFCSRVLSQVSKQYLIQTSWNLVKIE